MGLLPGAGTPPGRQPTARCGHALRIGTWLLVAMFVLAGLAAGAAPIRNLVEEGKLNKPPPDPNADPNAEEDDNEAVARKVTVDPALVREGASRYRMYCFKCHGIDMVNQGGGSFDLRTFPLHDKARFFNSVTNGKRTMPAWGAVLSKDDIEALWNYVANHQVSRRTPP
jgi:mono/diheme cytochrome c family protein